MKFKKARKRYVILGAFVAVILLINRWRCHLHQAFYVSGDCREG